MDIEIIEPTSTPSTTTTVINLVDEDIIGIKIENGIIHVTVGIIS